MDEVAINQCLQAVSEVQKVSAANSQLIQELADSMRLAVTSMGAMKEMLCIMEQRLQLLEKQNEIIQKK